MRHPLFGSGVLFLLVSLSACCGTQGWWPGEEPPATSQEEAAPPLTQPPEPAVVEKEEPDEEEAAPAQEAPGEPPPVAPSERMRAGWLRGSDKNAPQLRDLSGLFKELRGEAHQGALDKALLVCRVHTQGNFDTFRGPDLSATWSWGRHAEVTVRGPEDRWTMFASLPAVSLEKGQRFSVKVVDRDVFGSDSVGKAQLRYQDKAPLFLDSDKMEVECRPMDQARVEERLAAQLLRVDGMLRRAPGKLKPRPQELQWGLLATPLPELTGEVITAAAWVGWEEPRVQEAAARLDGLYQRWDDLARASVRREVEALPAVGTPQRLPGQALELSVRELVCGRALGKLPLRPEGTAQLALQDARCALRVQVSNQTVHGLRLYHTSQGASELPSVYLVRPQGSTDPMQLVGALGPDGAPLSGSLEAGQSADLFWALGGGPLWSREPQERRPTALWVEATGRGGRRLLLRLPEL